MEKLTEKKEGLAFEELEAQPVGLLPDRVEMRRRRRRRRGGGGGGVDVTNNNELTAIQAVVVAVDTE